MLKRSTVPVLGNRRLLLVKLRVQCDNGGCTRRCSFLVGFPLTHNDAVLLVSSSLARPSPIQARINLDMLSFFARWLDLHRFRNLPAGEAVVVFWGE